MRKKLVYVLFACLAMVNMALGQQNESRLVLNPEVPIVGQDLELTYDPKGGPLDGRTDLVGIVYMYNFYRWEMGDVRLKQEGDLWKGTFEVPDNCAFIAFKFQSSFIPRIIIMIKGLCLFPKMLRENICRVDTLLGEYFVCLH